MLFHTLIANSNRPEISHSVHQGALSHHQAHSSRTAFRSPTPPDLFLPLPSNSCRHNYTRLRGTCCASAACSEQLMPGCQSVQWEERDMRQEARWKKKKKKKREIPFMFAKERERGVIITSEALDCDLPPLCVNLCIHQVFTGSLCEEPRSFCLHLSENTTDRPGRELTIYSPHNAFTITSCVMVPRCTNSQIGKLLI